MAAPASVTSARTSAYQTAQEHDSSSPNPADAHSPIGFWTPAPSRLVLQNEDGDENDDQDDTPRAAAFQRALEEKAAEASGSSPVLLERYMDQDRTPAATPVVDVPRTRLQARLRASQPSQTSSVVSTPTTSALKIRTRSASRRAQSSLSATSPLPPLPEATDRPADLNISSALNQPEDTIDDETVIYERYHDGHEAQMPTVSQTKPEDEDETELLAHDAYADLPKPRVVIYVPAQPIQLPKGARSSIVDGSVSNSLTSGISRISDQAANDKRSDLSRTSSTISKPEDKNTSAGNESEIGRSQITARSVQEDPKPSSMAQIARPRLQDVSIPIQKTDKPPNNTRKAVFNEKRSRDKHASQRRRRQLHKKRKRMFSCANGPVYSRALF